MTAINQLGHVSTEGGPLLLVDFKVAPNWRGVSGDGNDYRRVIALLDTAREAHGLQITIGDHAAVVWEMATGTADVWRRRDGSLVICRPWLDEDDEHAEHFASLPISSPTRIGTFQISSGSLLILWAPEDGRDLLGTVPVDGGALDLSVGHAGITVRLAPGVYVCYHDAVVDHSEHAVRCHVVPATTEQHRGPERS